MVCTSLPISAGMYTPIFTIGAALGRFYGEILVLIFPSANIVPGAYAVVAAAALASGVTQTVSTAGTIR